jgi:hypothetical protein
MGTPQRIGADDLERQVFANIAEFGWHCVNAIEDDGHPPWTLLRLAGPFTRPCVRPASAPASRGWPLTATPGLARSTDSAAQ